LPSNPHPIPWVQSPHMAVTPTSPSATLHFWTKKNCHMRSYKRRKNPTKSKLLKKSS
jgi:hypothetical protein